MLNIGCVEKNLETTGVTMAMLGAASSIKGWSHTLINMCISFPAEDAT